MHSGLLGGESWDEGLSSGNYSKALKQALGFNDKNTYKLEVPGRTKHDLGRTLLSMPVQPLHEVLLEEVAETPSTPSG